MRIFRKETQTKYYHNSYYSGCIANQVQLKGSFGLPSEKEAPAIQGPFSWPLEARIAISLERIVSPAELRFSKESEIQELLAREGPLSLMALRNPRVKEPQKLVSNPFG